MRNVTITLDEEVARWARLRAADENTSVSRLVGAMLREKMKSDTSYETAMKDFLGRRPKKLRATAGRLPKRDDLYERK